MGITDLFSDAWDDVTSYFTASADAPEKEEKDDGGDHDDDKEEKKDDKEDKDGDDDKEGGDDEGDKGGDDDKEGGDDEKEDGDDEPEEEEEEEEEIEDPKPKIEEGKSTISCSRAGRLLRWASWNRADCVAYYRMHAFTPVYRVQAPLRRVCRASHGPTRRQGIQRGEGRLC